MRFSAGKKLKSQSEEAEAIVKELQQAGKEGLTREKLLELVIKSAASDIQFTTLVQLARSGMDYEFFTLLSERIDHAQGEAKDNLLQMREKLLKLTSEIDKAVNEQVKVTRELIEKLIKEPDIEKAVEENLDAVSELFVAVLNEALQEARQKGDLDRSGKLNRIVAVIQQASTPPPEYALVEELIQADNDDLRRRIVSEHSEEITPEFLQLLSGLVSQSQGRNEDPEITARLQAANRIALRFSMEANLKKAN